MSQEKKAGVANVGEEELSRMITQILTRHDTQSQADALFGDAASEARKKERAKLEQLFVQTGGAETMAPNLQKTAAAIAGMEDVVEELEKEAAAKNVVEFFEKKAYLTDAQRRYPELLKVINPRRSTDGI